MLEVSDQLFDTELCKEDDKDDQDVSANDVNLLQSNVVEGEAVPMSESIDNAVMTNNKNCRLSEHVHCNSSEDDMTYDADKTIEIMEMLLDPQLNIDGGNNTGVVAEVDSMNEKMKLLEEEEKECRSCNNTNENIKSIANTNDNTSMQTTSSLLTSSFTTNNTEHNLLTLLSTETTPRTSKSNQTCAVIDNVLPELFNGLD